MKFGLFLLAVELLLVGYSSAERAANDRKGIIWKQIENIKRVFASPKDEPQVIQNGTELTDLNDDCLLLILEQMDLDDLVNMAQINAKFSYLAKNVFKRMHSHHIRIERLDNVPKMSIFGQLMETQFVSRAPGIRMHAPYKNRVWAIEFNGVLQVYDYHLTLNILRYFGDVIKTLEIEGGAIHTNAVKILYTHINEYCASSLVRLYLRMLKADWLKTLKNEFSNLEELTVDISHKVSTITLSMSEKFPNLRRFSLKNWKRQNAVIILDGHLPYLEYLYIESSGRSEHKAFDNFLKQNPTIRHLSVSYFPQDYIETIHGLLPNLEHLTISTGYFHGHEEIDSPIHFKHLKVFNYQSYGPKSLTKISFSRLEELLIYFDCESLNQWIDFFAMNHTFTRFYVNEDFDAMDFELNIQKIVDALPPSVIDITINSDSGLQVETITRIIQSRKNLMKFQFYTPNNIDDFEDVLRAIFEEEWNITIPTTKYTWKQLLFIRKQSTLE